MTKIGQLLVRDGIATAAEVRSALRAQDTSGKRLGDVLLDRGIVSRLDLQRVLAHQHGRELEQEGGFGTGLRAALQQAHRRRRTLAA